MREDYLTISAEEHRLVSEASRKYGEAFTFTNEVIDFGMNMFSHNINGDCSLFLNYYALFRKSIMCSFLSCLRKNEMAREVMLRYAIESAIFACYALYDGAYENFIGQDKNGKPILLNKGKIKAYKWLEQNYSLHSINMKAMKDRINYHHSHSSLFCAMTLCHMTDDGKGIYFTIFDERKDTDVFNGLWFITNSIMDMIVMLGVVAKDYPMVKPIRGYHKKLKELLERREYYIDTNDK